MYGWLTRVREDTAEVVTANRRLARVLANEYNEQQRAAGRTAWRTPGIYAYNDWVFRQFDNAALGERPTRINSEQSRALWEQVLAAQIEDPLVDITGLGRQARDTWKRINEWNVPLSEIVSAASGHDQRVFAAAASRYQTILEANELIDDALVAAHVESALRGGPVSVPSNLFLAGFDRLTPQVERLMGVLESRGSTVELVGPDQESESWLMGFDNEDAELRAAGAWARDLLDDDAGLQLGIVVSGLERDSRRIGRLVREGFVPGWQYAPGPQASAVNVSFGRRLVDYPAIEIALLLLKWTVRELGGRDVSLLLRTPFLGLTEVNGRSRLELTLRNSPDRRWTPRLALRALGGREQSEDTVDWLARLSRVLDDLRGRPRLASPAYWAEHAEALLRTFNWPGEGALDSADFQLIDRWRDLLNDLAKLEIVVPEMSMKSAWSHLEAMAAEAVFQPEALDGVIQVLGPLEAAGMSFDRLWVSGMTANQWPTAGRPMALVSRRLQKHYGMPDAEPRDTADYAMRVVKRLLGSANECVFSYAKTAADSEQAPTALLAEVESTSSCTDPAWHAARLSKRSATKLLADDPVPTVSAGGRVGGGAATIQRQLTEPFGAFAYGRLGIRRLETITPGLSALIRGNLIHDALFRLYAERPTQKDIVRWSDADLGKRIKAAVDLAFSKYERHTDRVLKRLFVLERERVAQLLADVVRIDRQREPFGIDDVEARHDFDSSGLRLELRIDRVDRYRDGAIGILDYKTGARKRFLDSDGIPKDMQLAVYACALPERVATLGLFNVDSRETAVDEAGCQSMELAEWEESLRQWFAVIAQAAKELAGGDVRINERQTTSEARPLSLLSRYGELRRDA